MPGATVRDAQPEAPAQRHAQKWLTPWKMAFPPLSGIAAGLVVVFVASLVSGHTHPSVRIISPVHGAAVSQQKGFRVSGTFRGLGNDTLWLADYDGTGYAVDSEATIKASGSWTASDSDLGNPGQLLPFPLTVRLIAADAQCARTLQAAINSNQDYLTSLPGGCEIGAAVTVNVTRR
jgi:hypothetical protein